MTVTLISFYVLLWLMLVSEARERMLPPFLLLGAALGVARLSVAAGRGAFVVQRDFGIAIDGSVDVVALWALVAASSLISFAYLKASSRYRREERLAECGSADVGQILSAAKEARMECAVSDGEQGSSAACGLSRQPLGGCSSHDFPVGSCGRDVCFESTDAESKGISESVLEENATAFDEAARRFAFSQRETQVMREYAAGRSARYIAEWCMLSEHTVKTHIRRAYAKAGVHSRQEFLDAIERVESDLLHRGR